MLNSSTTKAASVSAPTSGHEVVTQDLLEICSRLNSDFEGLSGKRLLVTGGAGFLGYYLVQSVTHWNASSGREPIALTILDSFVRGTPRWLTNLAERGAVTLVRHDVSEALPASIGTFEYIMHAASIASPTHYRDRPLETMDANVRGLRRLLDLARSAETTKGLLVFSSSEIYGDPPPSEIPTVESYRGNVSCTGPRACYDESKRFCETLATVFARRYDTPVKIVRPFNNYGPGLRLDDRRLIPDLCRDILSGEDITLLSDGTATRTFCYAVDAVVGYFKVLIHGRVAEPYNIGVEAPETTVLQLAERLTRLARETCDYRGSIVHRLSPDRDYLKDNPVRRCPSIEKARTELDYRPDVDLDTGLLRTLMWYRDGLGNAE